MPKQTCKMTPDFLPYSLDPYDLYMVFVQQKKSNSEPNIRSLSPRFIVAFLTLDFSVTAYYALLGWRVGSREMAVVGGLVGPMRLKEVLCKFGRVWSPKKSRYWRDVVWMFEH